jgi:hypothetical protein
MSGSIKIEQIQTTLYALNRDFAGRRDMPSYDETKLFHIHRRNRAYVWNIDMQNKFLDSVLKGYYIQPIISCSHINNGNEKREVMDGGNRLTTIRRILNRAVRELTEDEYHRICSHPITLVVMRNLTTTQQREMFSRLNKNVKVSDGQLYAMSEDDSPLVQEAMYLLNDPNYPLRDRITQVFFDTVNQDNQNKRNLENAVALISGALNGISYITKRFSLQEEKVECQDKIDRSKVVNIIGLILEIFELANLEVPLTNKTKKKSQWTIGTYLGAILYDIHTCHTILHDVVKKWKDYIVMVRKEVKYAKDAIDIKGAQNINPDKLKRKSYKVAIFLQENRLATEHEMSKIKHIYAPDEVNNAIGEEDDYDAEDDNSED